MRVLVLLFVLNSQAAVNPSGPTVVNEYTSCLMELIDSEFKDNGLLIFANTNRPSTPVSGIRADLLKRINEKNAFSVQVTNPTTKVGICDNINDEPDVLHMEQDKPVHVAKYFVIIIDKYEEFSHVANELIRSQSWSPRAKFIILLLNFVSNDEVNILLVENILTCLFKYNVINIVVIVPTAKQIREAIIYGWRPYNPPKYCGYFNETAKDRLIVENKCIQGAIKYRKSVFEDLPINMKGCILYILALEQQPFVSRNHEDPNIEKIVIDQLLTKFKYKTNYEIINGFRGEREEDGKWGGALKELVSRRGQVLVGGIFPDFDVYEDFECSATYLADSYTWVVPKSFSSPPWIALTIIFNSFVWYSAIVSFFVCVLTWRVLGQLSNDTLYNQSLIHCLLNTWICTLGFCNHVRPVKEGLRIFFVFLNLYCMLLLTAYQTKLIDVLRYPTSEYQITTVEELVESGLHFGGFEELHGLFYNSSDHFDNYLGEKWVNVDDTSKALIDVSVHRNFSLLCSRMELAQISSVLPELSDSFGKLKYFAFERNMLTIPLEMVALRGFPYMKEFSSTLTIFRQNGLNEAVRKQFKTSNMRRRAKLLHSMEIKTGSVDALTTQHLQGGFFALFLGYVSGTCALFVELLANSSFVRRKVSLKRIAW